MTQPLEAVADAAEVVETAPEQTAEQTTETQTDAESLYAEDQPETDDQEAQEDETDDEEQPEAINAPASLNAEEKDKFAQLAPEAQRAVSEILSRRDRDVQQGLEQARSAQRDAERVAADRIAQTQSQYAQQFASLVQAFAPQPPSPELANADPGRYIALKAQFDQDAQTFNGLIGQISSLKAQADTHAQTRTQEWFAEQERELRSIPEYANAETKQQFLNDVKAAGIELGYPEEVIHQADAVDIMALHKVRAWKAKAEKWDRHEKKRNDRPRTVTGKFAAAPVGSGGASAGTANDTLKQLYPND